MGEVVPPPLIPAPRKDIVGLVHELNVGGRPNGDQTAILAVAFAILDLSDAIRSLKEVPRG